MGRATRMRVHGSPQQGALQRAASTSVGTTRWKNTLRPVASCSAAGNLTTAVGVNAHEGARRSPTGRPPTSSLYFSRDNKMEKHTQPGSIFQCSRKLDHRWEEQRV